MGRLPAQPEAQPQPPLGSRARPKTATPCRPCHRASLPASPPYCAMALDQKYKIIVKSRSASFTAAVTANTAATVTANATTPVTTTVTIAVGDGDEGRH